MFSRHRMNRIAIAAIVLDLCMALPAFPKGPIDPSPPKPVSLILLSGGECINCVEQEGEDRCDAQCVMPLDAILTNRSERTIIVRVLLTVSLGKDALQCGNSNDFQSGTYTLAAHSSLRIDFGHTFTGEFNGAVFTATVWVLPQPQWGGVSTEREMVFDAVVPVCASAAP